MKMFFMDIVKPPYTNIKIDGSDIHKWELITNSLHMGNEIHVLCDENCGKTQLNKLCFHKVPKTNVFKRLIYAMFLLQILMSYRFDILYTRTPANMNGIIGYVGKKIIHVPLVFEINGIAFDEQRLIRNESKASWVNIFGSMLTKLRKYKEIFMWKRADAIIVVTDGIKRFLIQYGINESIIHVIGNGANTELLMPIDRCFCLNKLGLDVRYRYVCFVGNLAPWQGVEYLIQSVPLILKSCPDARFLIIGDGIMKSEWVQLTQKLEISDKFIFTGSIPYEQVPLQINASDVCIVTKKPLKSGYSPLKLYEYMACGKPVIATRTDGFEILEECNAGILIDPTNAQELADAVIKLLLNEDLRKQMGTKGYEFVVENHSWASVIDKVADVCENVISEYNRS